MSLTNDEYFARAKRLHERAIVIDTHCDTTQRLLDRHWDLAARHDDGHVDIPRLRQASIDAIFLAIWAPGPVAPGAGVAAARRRIERIHDVTRQHDGELVAARTSTQVREAKRRGRIAVLLAIEGGYLIEDSLDVLREYHRKGATYLTLTHAFHTSWADSSGVHEPLSPRLGGLSAFGRDVVRELNRLGMMVDISHASDDTFWDALKTSCAPIIASHSSCRAVSPHRRNVTDEMMKAIAGAGGVVQINFGALFVDPDYPPLAPDVIQRWWAAPERLKTPLSSHVTPLGVLADHVDRALQLIGPEHVGIGSDFDGVPALPEGMEDCSKLPNLTAALLRRGYDETDLADMLGANILRVMDTCRRVAQQLQGAERSAEPDGPPFTP